ncbi:MAG: hypothetical protein UU40_C0013G0013 [Candidatus Uhrbacteria bacterium GW2011_GWD2_41_121]|uniref:Uncharacterized protein n=1 Tax=Candidatus Uhrbacteria bacterium GW2011_GWC1_41_20 TaxID=1618983 RepID=A0A0G0VCN8_9BACT|nr:MAG: hypothetical protein UT52_C0014G0013 [Candidatus Uhrbacteria bacterium GW2011_GWE1_39_46]KKR63743.1 MAG: hypothetical protein UU04_C0013G0014 [Candidatus Uhrbacteria bacterium GW2011_GWC2_40_450]KKR89868.1 MAG: hypothetical protein UU40_C0013G0013 [Candidatus Uhrbacteria bacterium GW2011_GWD2_41_121]KKR95697.1 MAG: hypothetical protein UU46_C0016G0010 [Candidatus Uhrbacteria bacterium GW2011_GWD1_41_16]KKR98633.1 MAG: hypothetical protein UU50_C0016G0010 [Candidatus Uhrbacteria bacteriu
MVSQNCGYWEVLTNRPVRGKMILHPRCQPHAQEKSMSRNDLDSTTALSAVLRRLAIYLIVGVILSMVIFTGIAWIAVRYLNNYTFDNSFDQASEQVVEFVPTPEEIEFARTVVGEGCDGTNCFVYIADPSMSAELGDADTKRAKFLRMITAKGDDLSFGISEGRIFNAVSMLYCKPEDRCGITPLQIDEGIFELVIYDAPRRDHSSYIQPKLKFVRSQEDLDAQHGW